MNQGWSSLRRAATMAAVGLTLLSVLPATGAAGVRDQVIFGNLQSARTVGEGVYTFGAGFMTGDNLTTVSGDFAYGFGKFTEGRARLGISDLDGPNTDPTIALGAEFKYQFWNYEGGTEFDDPFDLSFSGAFEFADYEFVRVTSIGANVLGSRPFLSRQGRRYGPYGRFNVRLQTFDPDGDPSDTDINFTLTPGFMVELTDQMTAMAEINLEDDISLAFGVSFGPF